LTLILTLTLT